MGLCCSPDEVVFRTAVEQSRIVITADLDFSRLLAVSRATAPPLILLRGGNYTEVEAIACLRRVLMAIRHDDLDRSLVVVDRTRIRRRWLPLE